ncbi:MAG TPA: di-heme oxidoredictase family protein [Polyangia bacterium]|nr:di-heme oxidoredictase family protein [Polyangia bacterium]
MSTTRTAALFLFAACAALGCNDRLSVDPSEALLGGDTTIFDDGDEAFAYPARNLSADYRSSFQIGDGIFNRNWVAAPATPQGADGLGPTFNGFSCSACHANNGRGATPASADDPFLGLLLRLSVDGTNEHDGPAPDPVYGDQLNPYGILGVPGEGTPQVTYEEMPGTYGDGESYSLRKPTYTIASPAFGAPAATHIGPRLAPQTVGLGLLEAVDESTVVGFAAQNGGHPNYVWNDDTQTMALGRFGWKANQPTLKQQALSAFRNDVGITNALYPTENCPPAQTACLAAPMSMTEPNLDSLKTDGIVVHALSLAVPARRDLDDQNALRGEQLFQKIGCASCHIPKMTTGTLPDWPELSNQTIRPFTDLLLHDMGPDLADGRSDYGASGSEWRTPPLWGLGLVEPIDGYLFLMHDGRARGFAEAILWHGGQGAAAREAFRTLSKSDRDALVAFLNSL